MSVGFASRAELHHLLHQLKVKYARLVQHEEDCPIFLCTYCWLHGPKLWLELTKGLAPEWCEMMNNCLVHSLDCALFFGNSLEATQERFFDLAQWSLLSDFVHAHELKLQEEKPPAGPSESEIFNF